MKFRWVFTPILMLCGMLFLCASSPVSAEEKKPAAKSADSRFLDFGDGAILDTKTQLMWMKRDLWLQESRHVNWNMAIEYIQKVNAKSLYGYADWRLPTPEEAATLYDRRKQNKDKDGDKIYLDRIFTEGCGWATWTSEEKGAEAAVVSYKDEGGKTFEDKFNGADAFVRLVRTHKQ